MNIDRLDHLVLTVKDIDATVQFYFSVTGNTLRSCLSHDYLLKQMENDKSHA
jgi:predicted enzyme related to lactoylglutathione lyase